MKAERRWRVKEEIQDECQPSRVFILSVIECGLGLRKVH
jgi:hypothetical protein